MRVLFDKSAPYGLARHLVGHTITTAEQCGWGRMENGDLLTAAEHAGHEVFLTADKNLRYQQNLDGRKIALVVLGQSPWPLVRQGNTSPTSSRLSIQQPPAAMPKSISRLLPKSRLRVPDTSRKV